MVRGSPYLRNSPVRCSCTVEVVCDDASTTDAYLGAVPAHLVLVCGIFGTVTLVVPVVMIVGVSAERTRSCLRCIERQQAQGRHDAYKMIVDGFSFWPASLFYVIAMALLFSHLGHGVASTLQTLGLANDKNWPFVKRVGNGLALVLFLGFSSIPVAVLFGLVTHEVPTP